MCTTKPVNGLRDDWGCGLACAHEEKPGLELVLYVSLQNQEMTKIALASSMVLSTQVCEKIV